MRQVHAGSAAERWTCAAPPPASTTSPLRPGDFRRCPRKLTTGNAFELRREGEEEKRRGATPTIAVVEIESAHEAVLRETPPPNAGRLQRLLQSPQRLHFAPEIPSDVRVNRQREMHSSCEGGERRKTGEEQCRPSPSLNSADDAFHPLTTNSRDRCQDESTPAMGTETS